MAGFKTLSRPVQPGDPVASGVTNRLPQDGFDNTIYLYDLLRSVQAGEAVFLRGRRVESTINVGQPVYYNAANQRFEAALAGITTDAEALTFGVTEASNVWGVVSTKTAAEVADILIFGFAPVSLAAAGVPAPVAGTYYLSTSVAGQLTASAPSVPIAVLRSDGAGNVFVNTQWRDLVNEHTHYKISLVCQPAGTVTPPAPGDRHTIDVADSNLPGWLPADDPIFEGRAPYGAVFGYNLSQHPSLQSLWPPLPISGAALVWTRASDEFDLGKEVPLGPTGIAIIDTNGLWWMSDCYGDVPWPVDFDDGVSVSESVSSVPECPRFITMRMVLYFIKPLLGAAGAVVTSLRAVEGSLLRVTCYPDGEAAAAGDLQIDLDLDFVSGDDSAQGWLVFKELSGNTFRRGPVVEGIKAGSERVTLSSTASRVDPGDNETIAQGIVTIDVDTDPASRELLTNIVRLNGVDEDFPLDVHGLSFLPGRTSSFRAMIHIPREGLPISPQIRLRFRLLGKTAGTLPTLTLTYRIIPPTTIAPPAAPVSLPASDSAGTLVTAYNLPSAMQYIDVESAPITGITPGCQLIYELTRSASDAYTSEVVALQYIGVLESGA